MSNRRILALSLLLVLVIAVLTVWLARISIATRFVEREFERRGVEATYKVTRIGFRTQRIENLVIGDPKRPDLTARWVEVDVALGWRRVRARLITARGVRLFGRLENGKVRLGELDKLLPPPTGRPFRLPNQRIDVADASIRLDTPAGRIGASIEGRGNLAFSFEGKIAAASRRLAFGDDCTLDSPALFAEVRTEEERPSLRGPLRAARIACGGVTLTRPVFTLDTTLLPGLDGGRGSSGVEIAELRTGRETLTGIAGRFSFDGGAKELRGTMDLAARSAALGPYRTGRASIAGRYVVAPRAGNASVIGDVAAAGVTGGAANLRPIVAALASAGGTPVEPIGDALAAAVERAGQGFDARASIRLASRAGAGTLYVERLRAETRSGASVRLGGGGEGFSYRWPGGATRIDGDVALSGGGFPATRLSLRQARAGAPIRGVARIAPLAASGAALQFSEIRFTAGQGGATRIDTSATLSGPFNDGRVDGLFVPVAARFGRGGFLFGESCVPVRFASLRAGGLRLGATRLPLCPTGRALLWRNAGGSLQGGALIRGPRLAGTLGQSPITLAAGQVRLALAEPGFTSSNVAIRLGREGAVNRLDVESLSGRFNARGVIGVYSGGEAKLAAVPLLMSNARGGWSVQRGDVAVDGALTVSDTVDPARFYPLAANDFRLTLDDNRIVAGGWLTDPETGTRVSLADIRHDLRTGRGNAVLDVPGIRFDENYQPEQLTRLTTGIVALVNGVLIGRGDIAWSPEGTTSTGTFSTKVMNLAAAFGPVEGLSTTIHFTDLLGLTTAPGQLAEIGVIRTGIDVFDGRLRYHLLPGMRVRVEGGRWPFAGGELMLDETILDFSQPTTKRLVFRVVGLDAARFVQQMEFSNITATGTFDGIIPMEFDARGGRIVGGSLVARAEGGTLSYIGALSDKQLGTYGKLAFDALKSLRYNKLTVALNGDLAGEFFAGIELDGVARDPALTTVGAGGGISGLFARRALGQLAKIPFEFNITIRGPFRSLMATARSLEDPSNLIQSALPQELRKQLPTDPPKPPVQPQESEIVR
jgi:hypothetical protein